MIEIKKESRHMLISSKSLINVSVYDSLTEREILVYLAHKFKIPANTILGYSESVHYENANKDTMCYIIEVSVISANVFHLLKSDNNFIVIHASKSGDFVLSDFTQNAVRLEYSDALILKGIFKRLYPEDIIMIYNTISQKILDSEKIITDSEFINSKLANSYSNYDLIYDSDITLSVEENFKGRVLSESLIWEIKEWCLKNKDYEIVHDIQEVEALGGGIKGKFFVAIDTATYTKLKDKTIRILRKRKEGE